MTYLELYERANRMLDNSEITLGEYEKMVKPLEAEVARWIPCSERLPNNRKPVLATGIYGAVFIASREYDPSDDEYIWLHAVYGMVKVIAWMPLPEPYEDRREDDETD